MCDPTVYSTYLRGSFYLNEKNIFFINIFYSDHFCLTPNCNYFFRQYKIVIRRIEDAARCQDLKLNDRIFIMKMHSVVYNQFASPTLLNMRVYAWEKSGYTVDKSTRKCFVNVNQSLFFNVGGKSCHLCEELSLLRCLYCEQLLCLKHFVVDLHLH